MMEQADSYYLMPGAIFFGPGPGQVKTLLGSCVAVTFWHEVRRVGGMCHFVLPSRGQARCGIADGRYGDEALELLYAAMARLGTAPAEYSVGVYGGGNMFPGRFRVGAQIGMQNVAKAHELVQGRQCRVTAEDSGEFFYRSVTLCLESGRVSVDRTMVREAG